MLLNGEKNKDGWKAITKKLFSGVLERAVIATLVALGVYALYPLFTMLGIATGQYLVTVSIAGFLIIWLILEKVESK